MNPESPTKAVETIYMPRKPRIIELLTALMIGGVCLTGWRRRD